MQLTIISEPEAWDRIESSWKELYAEVPAASSFLRWEWMREWWEVYGSEYGSSGGLRIFTLWRDSRLVAVLPLYLTRTIAGIASYPTLRFISTGEAEFEETCPDYLDMLCRPEDAAEAVQLLSNALASTRCEGWDQLYLEAIQSDSELLTLMASTFQGKRLVDPESAQCPYADLRGGWDTYLARLSSSSREQSRRLMRASLKHGLNVELAETSEHVAEFFPQLVELHQARWQSAGEPGCFAAPRFTRFHRALCDRMVPEGSAVLARVSQNGYVLALLYGFRSATRFEFYQSGIAVDYDGPVRSPGVAAHLLLMHELADRGVEEYDFLRGASEYKRRLATGSRTLSAVTFDCQTLRVAATRASAGVLRMTRKGIGTIRALCQSKGITFFPF